MPQQDDIRGRLREDHDGYLAELDSLGREADAHRCKSRLSGLRRAWAVHALAEESVVYSTLESAEAASNADVHADERFIEHELIEGLFEKLADGRPDTLEWHARLNVTRDLVARHIQNEQQDLFARLERRLDAGALRRMGAEFALECERLQQREEPKAA